MSERVLTIGHVLNGLPRAGNENLCLQLIKHSPPQLRVVLFNLNPARTEMKDAFLAIPGLVLVERPYTRDTRVSFIFGMARDLKKHRIDGLIVYPFGLHVLVALAARAVGVKRLVVHAGNPPPLDPTRRRLWKRIVVASRPLRVPIKSCSAMVDRELRALAGSLPKGSEPLLNGVDVETIERIAAEERAQRPPGSPPVIGMVARLDPIKDHETLLRAFARVRNVVEGAELWLIGEGEKKAELSALADQLGVASSVRFWGARPDVYRMLGQMDVFIFSTTRDEGFGIALAEAMAARTPIVASDVPACREVLNEGQAGKLVPPKDVDALAAAILELLTRPDTARALVERAYVRAQRELHIKRCAERFYASVTGS